MRILIVEDSSDYALLLTKRLEQRGHQAVTAVLSGALAIDAMTRERFDVVICDYNMPEMTGHEVFQLLRSSGHDCRFLLWTNEDKHALPKFEGFAFLGIVKKHEFDDLFGKLENSQMDD